MAAMSRKLIRIQEVSYFRFHVYSNIICEIQLNTGRKIYIFDKKRRSVFKPGISSKETSFNHYLLFPCSTRASFREETKTVLRIKQTQLLLSRTDWFITVNATFTRCNIISIRLLPLFPLLDTSFAFQHRTKPL